jgi:hypothetical protein
MVINDEHFDHDDSPSSTYDGTQLTYRQRFHATLKSRGREILLTSTINKILGYLVARIRSGKTFKGFPALRGPVRMTAAKLFEAFFNSASINRGMYFMLRIINRCFIKLKLINHTCGEVF